MTPADLLAAALRRDPARPFLMWYDDATGERVELSVATLANWVAKTANLLAEEDVDAVRLEPADHWLATVVALGAWTAGIPVRADGEPLPGEAKEFIASVLPQPDALIAAPPAPDSPALAAGGRTWSLEELATAARQAADHHGVAEAARVLSTLGLDTLDGLDAGLLIPLAVGGSVVRVAHCDESQLAHRTDSERVTHRLG